jgi:hypothetical protein
VRRLGGPQCSAGATSDSGGVPKGETGIAKAERGRGPVVEGVNVRLRFGGVTVGGGCKQMTELARQDITFGSRSILVHHHSPCIISAITFHTSIFYCQALPDH